MDLEREIATLISSGLRFSIEIDGGLVVVRFGDYLRQHALMEIVGNFEDALEWLGRQRDAAMA